MTTLIIAEHNKGHIAGATYNTLAAAQKIGTDIHVLLLGHDIAALAQVMAQAPGVSKVLVADAAALTHLTAENATPVLMSIAKNYSHILANASTAGKNLLPRVSALLDVQMLSEITEVVTSDTFKRPVYAGNAIATVQSLDAIKLMTVRSTGFDAAPSAGGSAAIEALTVIVDNGLSQFVGQELTVSARPELTAAKIIISGGRGMQSGDNFKMLEQMADQLGAAVGASRAAVDAGFVPNDYQVGQTGKIVAPDLYIAVGISGAIQHLAGMKDSKVIVAINKDEEAPIFSVADYGLVGDLFKLVPELNTELAKLKN